MNLATHSPAVSPARVAALALFIWSAALAGACQAKQELPAKKNDEPTVIAAVAHDAATKPSDAALLTLPPAPPLAPQAKL